ncbi:MAG: PilN domain-containing protein [Pseudomonadota bacterium]
MIRINLLPFRAARKKENVRRQISMFLLTVLMVGLALFYYNSYLGGQVTTLMAAVSSTQEELQTYEKKNREVAVLKKQLDILVKKTEVIESLAANREEAVRLMDTMTQVVVPERMWLTSFSATDTQVSLSGTAIDNRTIAEFMLRLEAVDRFKDVTLQSSRQIQFQSSIFLKTFSIMFQKSPITPTMVVTKS